MALEAGLIVYRAFFSVGGLPLVTSKTVGILEGSAEILFLMGLNSQRDKSGPIVCLPALPGMAGFTGYRQPVRVNRGFWIGLRQHAVAGVAVVALGAGAPIGPQPMTVLLFMTLPALDGPRPWAGLVALILYLGVAVPAAQVFPVDGALEFGRGHGAGGGPSPAMALKTLVRGVGPG